MTTLNKRTSLRVLFLLIPMAVTGLLISCAEPVDSKDKVICLSGDCSSKKAKSTLPQTPLEGQNPKDALDQNPGNVATLPPAATATASPTNPVLVVTPTPGPTATPAPTPVPPLPAKTVMLKLREACQGCHGLGKDKQAFWRTPGEFENPTQAEIDFLKKQGQNPTAASFESILDDSKKMATLIEKLSSDTAAAEIFQTIENKIANLENAIPKAMRPSMDDSTRNRFAVLMQQLDDKKNGKPITASTIKPLSLDEAKSWCTGCHSPGGSGSSVWDKAGSDESEWQNYALTALNTVKDKRMPPPKLEGAEKEAWLGVLAFFQRRIPGMVADARLKYHGQDYDLGTPIDQNFVCTTPLTGREFINQLTITALNRSPTQAELNLIAKPNEAVTTKDQDLLVAKLTGDWKDEFIDNGLQKFAHQVVNATAIQGSLVITDEQLKADITDEFYAKLKDAVQKKTPYHDVLKSNMVFATKKTGPFYGSDCLEKTKNLAAGQYAECNMAADGSPRSGFFTTMGFLAGKPSSMVVENNNYGRVARMNEVIRGEPLRANTAGELGETVKDLPSCMVSNDRRVLLQGSSYAPRGTMSVPESGNFCQGCHIQRNLAAGAIAFRPFGFIGEIITTQKLDDLNLNNVPNIQQHDIVMQKAIKEAIKPTMWRNLIGNKPEDKDIETASSIGIGFFRDLLNLGTAATQEKGCVVDGNGNNLATVTKVSDLVNKVLIENELPRGLARIVPRAFSNRNSTSTEVVSKMTETWTNNNGQLLPVLASYYATRTFACKF